MSPPGVAAARGAAADAERTILAPDVLLVSEIYPPTVGGSGVLLQNVYSRLPMAVRVVTEPTAELRGNAGASDIVFRTLATRDWSISRPSALGHHLGVAMTIRRQTRRARSVVHCARALPEGLAAFIARRALAGSRYVCWAHGEDIATAQSSREQSLLMRAVFRGAAASIANSRNTAAMLDSIGVPPSRVRVVYPGVDATRFRPEISGASVRRRFAGANVKVLLSVGRLQTRKGHDQVIAALPALLRDVPAVQYVIVGDGDGRASLERQASALGVRDRVTFCGEVPDDELPAYYGAADVFVMPNRKEGEDIEGFGIVFLEAAASGIPAVGGRSGGVPEAVEDGVTGVLVGGTDPAELAGVLSRLLRFADERDRMGRAARARVERAFTWERAATAVAAIQDEVIRG